MSELINEGKRQERDIDVTAGFRPLVQVKYTNY